MFKSFLRVGFIDLVLFCLMVGIRKVVHKEGLQSFGIHFDLRGYRFLKKGFIIGFISILLYGLIVVCVQKGSFTLAVSEIKNTVTYIVIWGFLFFSVALFEEGLFRGYLLSRLLKYNRNYAIIIQAILFSVVHFEGYTRHEFYLLGFINAFIIGVILAILFIKTGSLMLAIGFHFSWNFTRALLMNEFLTTEKILFNLEVTKSIWTGNSYVIENGLVVSIILVANCFFVSRAFGVLSCGRILRGGGEKSVL